MLEKTIRAAHAAEHEFELATLIVQKASQYKAGIQIGIGEKRVNAKSIMGVSYLSITDDDEVYLQADGPDEEAAVADLAGLIEG